MITLTVRLAHQVVIYLFILFVPQCILEERKKCHRHEHEQSDTDLYVEAAKYAEISQLKGEKASLFYNVNVIKVHSSLMTKSNFISKNLV